MGRFNWGMDGPPEDAYSRVTEPERFAVLHDVADEIVEELRARFDARVTELDDVPAPMRAIDHVRIARIEPRIAGAPITVMWTTFPALQVGYGWWQYTVIPPCGCDACDEDGETTTAELRSRIDGIVERGFTEELSAPGEGMGPTARRLFGPRLGDGPPNAASDPAQAYLAVDHGTGGGGSIVGDEFSALSALHAPGTVTWPAWS